MKALLALLILTNPLAWAKKQEVVDSTNSKAHCLLLYKNNKPMPKWCSQFIKIKVELTPYQRNWCHEWPLSGKCKRWKGEHKNKPDQNTNHQQTATVEPDATGVR